MIKNSQFTWFILLLILPVYSTCPLWAGENRWTTEGPWGASVKTIAINPMNHSIIFIGTIQDGIYKSVDAGENWGHIESEILHPTLRQIVYHPSGPDTIYAPTAHGLFKSIDGGDTWYNIAPSGRQNEEFRALVLDPLHPNIVITGGNFDRLKSTDSGQNWQSFSIDPVGGIDQPIDGLALDPANTNIIYLVTASAISGKGIYKSIDGAATWSNIHNNSDSSGDGRDVIIDPVNTNIVYYARNDGERLSAGRFLSKSTNGGASWSDISPPVRGEWGAHAVAISPFDHNTIYAGTVGDGVFKSTDAGQTWVAINTGLGTFKCASLVIDSMDGTLYLGTYVNGIYKSTDNGAHWRKISQNLRAGYFPSLAFAIGQPMKVFAAGDGCYSQDSEGAEWQYVPTPIPLYNDPGAIETDKFSSQNIYLASTSVMPFSPEETGFYRSTDVGQSWAFLNNGLPGDGRYTSISISYLQGGDCRIFLASPFSSIYPGLYYSDNIGDSWAPCNIDLPLQEYNLVEAAPSDSNIIAVSDYNNRIYISMNRGVNWAETTPLPRDGDAWVEGIQFDPYNANHIFASTPGYGLYESNDLGQSWVNINNDLPLYPGYPIVFGPAINPQNTQNMFVASNQRGVYQTHDGGAHWESFNDGLDTTFAGGEIYFVPGDTTRLYYATYSRSVWSIHRTVVDAVDEAAQLPDKIALSVYPNPFNSRTTIRFSLSADGPVSIEIYDILGRKVETLSQGVMLAGSHALVWDAAGRSSGVYFLALKTSCGPAGRASAEYRRILLLK